MGDKMSTKKEKSEKIDAREEPNNQTKNRFSPSNWCKKEKKLLFKLGAVLIVGLIFMNVVSSGSSSDKQPAAQEVSADSGGHRSNEAQIERQLGNVLSKIKGAGEVSVAITFEYSAESEYAVNQETVDRISTEGVEKTVDSQETQHKTSIAEQDGSPVLIKEYMPKVKGVLVVASGAGKAAVKRQLFKSVEGLLGVAAHRINVVEGL
ncbi:MAG: hypothetical protein ACOX05_06430 [Bacillota bacterium]|jgi:stage III sporulation protein AG